MTPKQPQKNYSLDRLQRVALGGMLFLTILTFVGANLHALLWQSSQWLVSTVLPAVVVDLTNDERADVRGAPLRRNATLDRAARLKAEHMAKNEYFAHYAPDGTSPWYWFDQAGYVYAHAGENLAIHFTDSSEVVEAWMNSPTHRENIVNGDYTEIGVGTAKGQYEGYDTVYVVQLFGAPAAVPAAPVRVPTPAQTTAAEPAPADETVLAAETSAASETVTPVTVESETSVVDTVTPDAKDEVVPPVTASVPKAPVLDTVVVESMMIATSSGLAVATIMETPPPAKTFVFAGLATAPHELLQLLYVIFGSIVLGLLIASVVVEFRRRHFIQTAYGAGLLAVMVGMWYVHALLTAGAVIA